MSKLINWAELSRTLSGSDNLIRPARIPKKYKRRVDRFLLLVKLWEAWANKHKCKNEATKGSP